VIRNTSVSGLDGDRPAPSVQGPLHDEAAA
jgi:hypothetical protein